MKMAVFMQKLWSSRKRFPQYCMFCWNRIMRGLTVDRPPIFIVGCGHSGTSILLAILGSHSNIYAIPYESWIATNDNPMRFRKNTRRFDRWAIAAGKGRWIEKTPKHICHIGRILEWCPDARILLVIRDGRDVSCSFQDRGDTVEYGITRWVDDNLAGKNYWNNANTHVVKYEDIVGDFECTIKKIVDFLGEEYEDSMKEYYKTPREWYSNTIAKPGTAAGENHRQYRNWQINQPLFDGRGKWKRMSSEELSLVNEIAGAMLAELGYYSIAD